MIRYLLSFIIGLLIVSQVSNAQLSQTIHQQVITNKVLADMPFGSSPVHNIGQSYHQLIVFATGANCTTTNADGYKKGNFAAGLEASYDGTAFFRIGGYLRSLFSTNFDTTAPFWGYVDAVGVYPLIRAAIYNADANCTYNAWYSGVPYQQSATSKPAVATKFGNYADYGAAVATNLGVPGMQTLKASDGSGRYTEVIGLLITNKFDKTICITRGAACDVGSPMIPAGETVTLPITGYSYFRTEANEDLTLVVPAGAAGTSEGTVWYRQVIEEYQNVR